MMPFIFAMVHSCSLCDEQEVCDSRTAEKKMIIDDRQITEKRKPIETGGGGGGGGGNGKANDEKIMSTDKIENKTRPKR